MKKVVIGLSGGMDSVTMLAYYIYEGIINTVDENSQENEIFPIIFNYGSKHNKFENKAALDVCKFYNIEPKLVDLPFVNQLFKSNLLNGQGDIPEGHYQAANMSQTVVPGRNLIFLSIMAGYAESIGADTIAFGAHSGDHAIYPDCRPEFAYTANATIFLSSDKKIIVESPFLYMDKTKILEVGYSIPKELRPPYELTRTCYKDQETSCGKCGSCQERLEAFKNIGKKDPIKYE